MKKVSFEIIRMAADLIVFAAALAVMFYLINMISNAIELCMPVTEFMEYS